MSSRRRVNRARGQGARANRPAVDLDALASTVVPSTDGSQSDLQPLDESTPAPPPRRARPSGQAPPSLAGLAATDGAIGTTAEESVSGPPPRRGAKRVPVPVNNVAGTEAEAFNEQKHGEQKLEQTVGLKEGTREQEASSVPPLDTANTEHQNQQQYPSEHHKTSLQNQHQPSFGGESLDTQPFQQQIQQEDQPRQQHHMANSHGSLPLPNRTNMSWDEEDNQEEDAGAWDAYTNIELEESQQLGEAGHPDDHQRDLETEQSIHDNDENQGHEHSHQNLDFAEEDGQGAIHHNEPDVDPEQQFWDRKEAQNDVEESQYWNHQHQQTQVDDYNEDEFWNQNQETQTDAHPEEAENTHAQNSNERDPWDPEVNLENDAWDQHVDIEGVSQDAWRNDEGLESLQDYDHPPDQNLDAEEALQTDSWDQQVPDVEVQTHQADVQIDNQNLEDLNQPLEQHFTQEHHHRSEYESHEPDSANWHDQEAGQTYEPEHSDVQNAEEPNQYATQYSYNANFEHQIDQPSEEKFWEEREHDNEQKYNNEQNYDNGQNYDNERNYDNGQRYDDEQEHGNEQYSQQPHIEESGLDDMLDDDELLDEDDANTPDYPHLENLDIQAANDTVIHHANNEVHAVDESDKLRALEMLDLDEDLLLDEEFLEEEDQVSVQPQAPEHPTFYSNRQPPTNHRPNTHTAQSKYTPSSKYNPVPSSDASIASREQPQTSGPITALKPTVGNFIPTETKSQPGSSVPLKISREQDQVKEKLNEAKKKNDAYDFPSDLIKAPAKPARATAKPTGTISSASSRYEPPSKSNASATLESTHAVSSPSQSNTSMNSQAPPPAQKFFEDLPVNAVKPPTRARAAQTPHNSTVNPAQITSPVMSQTIPNKLATPKNPYATLQTKNPLLVAQLQQPVTTSAPTGQKYQPQSLLQPGMSPQPPNSTMARPPVGYAPQAKGQIVGLPQPSGLPMMQQHALAAQPFPNAGYRSDQAQNAPRVSINTSVQGRSEKTSITSPYVPDEGPYGPNVRGHSRTSSIIGGNAKDGNPYVPLNGPPPVGTQAKAAPFPGQLRGRGGSMNRSHRTLSVSKVQNPQALLERQFPIFLWSHSLNTAYLIPQVPFSSYDPVIRTIKVGNLSDVAKQSKLYCDFPGPLTKTKAKKKELEAWLQKIIAAMETENPVSEEIILAKVLRLLVSFDGDFGNKALHLEVAKVLTPNVDYSQEATAMSIAAGGQAISANAYKLDNLGINQVWNLIQTGKTEDALTLALSKGDWALGFIIASSMGQETFAKVASDYARRCFPFQKGPGIKVQHLMPVMMKLFAGNSAGVISDFENVPSEGEFAKAHYREIIAAAIINNCGSEFLVDFGKFLSHCAMDIASELCFIIGGFVMTPTPFNNGATFQAVGASTPTSVYTEVYEYILQTSPVTSNMLPPTGLPHLLQFKLKRAQTLADYGFFVESRKYCDYLGGAFKSLGKSPYLHPGMTHEFQQLLIRLSNSGTTDSSWLGGILSKVNLDKMWGRLDKIIGGEESVTKAQDTSLFRNFSPSISRNASAIDVSQMVSNGYLSRPDLNRSASLASAPAGHSDFSPVQPQPRGHSLRYTPGVPSGAMKGPPSLSGVSSHQPPGQPSLKPHSSVQKYHPNSESRTSVNGLEPSPVPDEQKLLKQASSASSRPPPSRYNAQRPGVTSADHGGPHKYSSHNNEHRSFEQEEKFDLPELKEDKEPPVMQNSPRGLEKGHFRTSLLQSDFLDVPDNEPHVPSTIKENSKQSTEAHEVRDMEPNEPESAKQSKSLTKDSDEKHVPPPPVSSRKAYTQRVNPYAPGGQSSKPPKVTSNKYAPSATSSETKRAKNYAPVSSSTKYIASSEANDDDATQQPSQQNELMEKSTTKFAPKDDPDYNGAPTGSSNDNKDEKAADLEKSDMTAKKSDFQAKDRSGDQFKPSGPPVQSGPPRRKNPYAPNNRYTPGKEAPDNEVPDNVSPDNETSKQPKEGKGPSHDSRKNLVVNANIDVTVDYGVEESMEVSDTSRPQIQNKILLPTGRTDYANPFSNERGVEGGLDDFPIPGSPEYTTRANSVIGNNGLFSSKLSQSQQSVMYQQYEVKDDTVHDYVPVPEDDDDEEDKKLKKKEEQKKNEEERKKAEDEQKNVNKKDWLSRFRGQRNDDKPKPVKAKMGVPNAFEYSEEHKRWIDTRRPLEEQLKESAPPPPPTKKKVGGTPQAPQVAPSQTPSGSESTPDASGAPRAPSGRPGRAARRVQAKGDLANAGLDDLLSLSSGVPSGGRKPKRRYVNVMEQK